jgi:O-antigen/teichoic acid export membrane protein
MTGVPRLTQQQRIGFLARDSAIYGLASGLNKVLALFTFPLLARHFSVADFGTIDLLNTSAVLLVTLLIFGQDSAAARYYYETDDTHYRKQIVTQAFMFQIVVMAVVLPAAWMFADSIANGMNLEESRGTTLVRLILAQAPFFLFITYSQGLLKWTFRRWRFLFLSVGSTVVTLIALFAALGLDRLGLVDVFLIYLATRALFGLLGLWFVRDLLTWPVGLDKLRLLLPFAIPFGVVCVIVSFQPVLERWLVSALLGTMALGFYAAGAKIAMLINLPINALEMSWGPFSLSLHKEKDASITYNLVLKTVCLLLFAAVLGLTAVADFITTLLGSQRYEGAGVVAFALCMGLAVQAISLVTTVGIVFSKRAYLKLYAYGALLATAAVAITVLAPIYGIAGAAWGSMIAMVSKTLVETALAQRAWPLPWHFAGPCLLGTFTLAIGFAHQLTYGSLSVAGIELVPFAGLAFLFPLAWLGLLNSNERRRVITVVRDKLGNKKATQFVG